MTKAMEEARAIAQLFDDIYVRDGFCDWADVATARDEALRLHATALATRDAEIDQARSEEREACIKAAVAYCWERYKGREPMNLNSPAVFTSHEWQKIEEHIRRALTAGGQHG